MLIEPLEDGSFQLDVSEAEASVLSRLCSDLGHLLSWGQGEGPPSALRRLFPPAHPHDPVAEAAYQEIVGSALLDARRHDLQVVADSVERDNLSRDELESWLRAFNSLRLVLGTLMDVSEESSVLELDEGDPTFEQRLLYDDLGNVVALIVHLLSQRDAAGDGASQSS